MSKLKLKHILWRYNEKHGKSRNTLIDCIFFFILITIPISKIESSETNNITKSNSSSQLGPVVIKGAFQCKPVTPHTSDMDLRDLPKIKAWKTGGPVKEIPRRVNNLIESRINQSENAIGGGKLEKDSLLEVQEEALVGFTSFDFSSPDLNFEGIGHTGAYPPDTVGEIGKSYYIQMVNSSGGTAFTIFDKNNGSVVSGPSTLSSLWNAGGSCSTGNGDPIVLYDTQSDRWLLSEFASSGHHLCVYISKTSDPVSGGWYLYDFNVPEFPDYPKYGIWPDAYYVSTNEPNPAVYALERQKMLNGQTATFQRFAAAPLTAFSFQALTPGDLDGPTPPPTGSPGYFIRHVDGEANGETPDPINDTLQIWEFSVDWDNSANSTFKNTVNISVSDFDSDLCGLTSFNCIPQPGTNITLDPLREVVMWRLQYRNFSTHETLVGNFVTDVDGTDHAGIRWFELRKSQSGSWTLFQEGTYAPDIAHRWMGSIAMDQSGNIALGYSISSPELGIFPSIRYAGRLSSDSKGIMTQGEYTLIEGLAPQINVTRWGDYSSMNIDPADDCTFWYTNEYITPNGLWSTRVGAFKFSSCKETITGATPVTGDWDGNGTTDIGVYVDGKWFLDSNGNGTWDSNSDKAYSFPGWSGATPVTGDWNGDGTTNIGIYVASAGKWFLDLDGSGAWSSGDKAHSFPGWSAATPITGDWDGNGTTDIGVYVKGIGFLDADGSGAWNSGDKAHSFPGWSAATPITGDWDGNGTTDIGVYVTSAGKWFLDLDGSGAWSSSDKAHSFPGWSGATPVTGDWDGNGTTDIGVYVAIAGKWFLDADNSGAWSNGDKAYSFPD